MHLIFASDNYEHVIEEIVLIRGRVYAVFSFYNIRTMIFIVRHMGFADAEYRFAILIKPFNFGFRARIYIFPPGLNGFVFF